MKGTLLAHLSDDYMLALDNIRVLQRVLEAKKAIVPELKAKVRAAQTKYQEASKARDQKKKADEIKKEYAWALVKRKEDQLETQMKALVKLESRLPRLEESFNKLEVRPLIFPCVLGAYLWDTGRDTERTRECEEMRRGSQCSYHS